MANLERRPERGRERDEDLDLRHFYAAYIFDQAHERQRDVATIVEQAQRLGNPGALLVVVRGDGVAWPP